MNSRETALITGASRGLGKASAIAFAGSGYDLALCSRDEQGLGSVAEECQRLGAQCIYECLDVKQAKDMENLAERTAKALRPVSLLVNNAAVIGPPEFMSQDISADWSETIDINLKGPVNAIKAVLPGMLEYGGAAVINVISGLAWVPFPRFSAYCASKAGLQHLNNCLAEEYKDQDLRFYCLDPGIMDTTMQSHIRSLGQARLGPLWRQFKETKETGQLRDPSIVADLVLALAAKRPEEKNGQVISVRDWKELLP